MSAPGWSDLNLAEGMALSGLTFWDLWLRQAALGGDADEIEVEAYVLGLLSADPYHHDVIAHALNEFLVDSGQGALVAYAAPSG